MAGVPVTVDVRGLTYKVASGKTILKDVNVRFNPGEIACLMGPSGSGKTTLLSNILGNAAGKSEGDILVNGESISRGLLKSVSKLVPQEDVLLTSFTVRETFYYQGELVLPPMSRAAKDERIARVVQALGLESCLDVKIGHVEERGISGGQRKRVSIGMDLISDPAALFVDEPTSGLDSKTAEDVVNILRDLAKGDTDGTKRTVVTTIHQPSYRIFALFDKVVLITGGRIAFQGQHAALEQQFETLGFPVPLKENPADHYMRLLQDEDKVDQICDFFSENDSYESAYPLNGSAAALEVSVSSNASTGTTITVETDDDQLGAKRKCCWPWSSGSLPEGGEAGLASDGLSGPLLSAQKRLAAIPRYPTSIPSQFVTLFKRATWDTIKDPNKLLRTLFLKTAVGVLVGIVWWHAAQPPRLQKLVPIEGAMFIILMNSCIDTLATTIIIFPTQRALMLREYKNGSYSLLAFYPALMLSMAMMSILYAFIMGIPIYLMVELQLTAKKLTYFILIVTLMTVIGNALGVIVGATSATLLEAQSRLMPVLAPLVLFSGYVIRYKDMRPAFRIFYKISFFQYGLSAMQLNQLTDLTFDLTFYGFTLPVPGEFVLRRFLDLDPDKHHTGQYVLILLGYAIGITFLGYWIIKWELRRKTG